MSKTSSWVLFGPPLVFGALLRLWGIQRQVLGGDEFHAVLIAASRPLGNIVSNFLKNDHCVPLAALVRLSLQGGIEPSEIVLRLPVLLAGLALIPVLGLLVRRAVGARAACVFAWLLALSPLMVLYGRILRSYGPMLLLASLAAFAFHRWLEQGKRRDAIAYVLAAPLAVYFHLLAAVFVSAPLAYAVLVRPWRRGGPGLRAILGVAALTALVAAVLFAPLAESMLAFIRLKSGRSDWNWATAWGAVRLQSGVLSPLTTGLFWIACGVGVVRMARHRPGVLAYLSFLCGTHLVALLVAGPQQYSTLIVFNRYVILLLPVLLLFAACAFGIEGSSGRDQRGAIGVALPATFCLLLFLDGPLVSARYLHGSFTHHNNFLAFVEPGFDRAPGELSSSTYSWLASDPEARVLVEYPVDVRWSRSNAAYYGQELHGKEVLVSSDLAVLCDRRFRWRQSVACDPEAYLDCRADYLVIHRDAAAEESRVTGTDVHRDTDWRTFVARARMLRRTLRESWGEPAFEDEEVAVWDLRKARAARVSAQK